MSSFRSKIGIFILICSFIFLIFGFNFNLTGSVIAEYFKEKYFIFRMAGFVSLFISILMLTERRDLDAIMLDAIIIPIGNKYKRNIRRAKKGAEEEAKYYVISGYRDKNRPIKESQTADIYRELRKYGIKPSEIKIESESRDTLENAMNSLNKLKGLKRIGIVSYPEHLKRFNYIINKAKKEGFIDEDIEIVNIPTEETFMEKAYGVVGNIEERYRLRNGIERAQKKKNSWVRKVVKKVLEH